MKTEICNFSGLKIYPGHGKLFVRGDSKVFRFLNGKCESYFHQRLRAAKLDWTVVFRRLHKKDQAAEITKKRVRKTAKTQRAVAGADLDALKALKNQKPAERQAARQLAMEKSKKLKKESQDKKKAEKAKLAAATRGGQKVSKQQAKGAAPKVQAKSR